MAITADVNLTSGGDSVTVRGPDLNCDVRQHFPGVVHRLAGGGTIRYQLGPIHYEATISCSDLTRSNKESLDDFFVAHWRDATGFTFRDNRAVTYSGAVFLDPELAWTKIAGDKWAVSFRLALDKILD